MQILVRHKGGFTLRLRLHPDTVGAEPFADNPGLPRVLEEREGGRGAHQRSAQARVALAECIRWRADVGAVIHHESGGRWCARGLFRPIRTWAVNRPGLRSQPATLWAKNEQGKSAVFIRSVLCPSKALKRGSRSDRRDCCGCRVPLKRMPAPFFRVQ